MKAVYAGVILFAIVLGVFFAPYFNVSDASLLALFAIFFVLSLSVIPQRWLWLVMIAIGFFFLGILRYHQYDLSFEGTKYTKGQEIQTKAQVVEPPEDTKKTTKIVVHDSAQDAKILLIMRPFSHIEYGDMVSVKGKVTVPEEESYQNSLRAKGISAQMLYPEVERVSGGSNIEMQAKGALFSVRRRFEESINQILPEPESSFLAGLLLGAKRSIPDWLTEDLKKSGTTHLIALSGFNITVIIEGLRIIFSKKSAKMSFFVPLAAIFSFVVMTGAASSVVRAGIMGAMVLLAHRVGRQSSSAMAIAITAATMIIINPYILRLDIGFQLSFAAFIGIIYLAPIIKELLPLRSKTVKEILSATLGAQIMAYPILLYYFGSFSTVALLTNLVVLPFIPLVMLLGFVSAFLGMIWPYLGYIVSWTVFMILRIVVYIIHFSANLSFSSFSDINFSATSMFLVYLLVLEVIFIYRMIKRRRLIGEKSR